MTTIEADLITEPGVYADIPEDVYLADPVAGRSLSSSGARLLIPPDGCPAKFRWHHDHPGHSASTAMDIGSAAHQLVLGVGPEPVVVDAPDWRTKAARQAKAEAQTEGRPAVLASKMAEIEAMAAALRAHPVAAAALGGPGQAEVTLVWDDPATGVRCRARLDWLPTGTPGRRLVFVDYKTTPTASPESCSKSIGRFGYHQQATFYADGIRALGLAQDVACLLLFQEVEPPYLVTPVELDPMAIRIGNVRNAWARQLYAHCTATDTWPAYVEGIAEVPLPRWVEIEQGRDLQ